jgi:hypothetical protein
MTYIHSFNHSHIHTIHLSLIIRRALSLHLLMACKLSGKNLPVVPSRESNSGLPYRKPTCYQLLSQLSTYEIHLSHTQKDQYICCHLASFRDKRKKGRKKECLFILFILYNSCYDCNMHIVNAVEVFAKWWYENEIKVLYIMEMVLERPNGGCGLMLTEMLGSS